MRGDAPATENICLLWRSPSALLARRRGPQPPQTLGGGTKTPKKLRAALAETSSRAQHHQSPQHIPTEARTRPSPSRVRKIPSPVLSCSPNQPASFQPGKRDQPGATLGLKASHTIPTRKHPRPQKKSQQPLRFLGFFCCCISYIIQFHILIGSAIIEQLILKSFNTSETAMVR